MTAKHNDLFDQRRELLTREHAPLADRMRPRTIEEFIGQQHIIGQGRLLRRAIQIDQLSSLIFYGPPGTGKTTLARIIANTTKAQFLSINAVLAGVKEIRESITKAHQALALHGTRTILFIDEVHRFNKAQQDALLPHVENGTLTLIGATTENPYFEVNKALVSRSRIFQLKPLTVQDLRDVARQALGDVERGYGGKKVTIDEDALDHLVATSNGDARGVLNALELAVETTAPGKDETIHVTRAVAEDSIQHKAVLYDKDGDAHYDTVSAFIKSVRGSDPDAALYWMARMVYAGEDPRFIFRRMLILACEDIGLADPHALTLIVNAARAFDYVGLPEGRFHLAHACLYLATAPKSNSTMAFFDALRAVENESKSDDVPDHLRDASRDADDLGHGQGYLYPHAFRDHWVAQQYLPEILQGRMFYQPSDQGYEKEVGHRISRTREAMIEAAAEDDHSDPWSVRGTGAQEWIHRAKTEQVLGEVREQTIKLAEVGRESLVLDVNPRTGLLCFEAARKIREGSVWALARDDQSYEALTSMAQQYDALSRPQILRADWTSTREMLEKSGLEDAIFTSIMGRAVLANRPEPGKTLSTLLSFLHPEGILVLAEPIASAGSRPSEFLSLGNDLLEKLRETENRLFSSVSLGKIEMTSDSLKKEAEKLPGTRVRIVNSEIISTRRFGASEIGFWFRETNSTEMPSLGTQLRSNYGSETARQLQRSLRNQLSNRDLSWKTCVAYVVIAKQH